MISSLLKTKKPKQVVNRTVLLYTIYLLILASNLALSPTQTDTRLQEKIHNAIKGTFGTETFETVFISVPKELNAQTRTDFSGERFFKVEGDSGLLGYAYVGTAPSMKKEFEYILMFNPDWSIKKSKVLIYRENYGRQIGSQRWLIKFVGLSPKDQVTYGETIDGIAGATISASSLTDATNDVLSSLKVLLKQAIIH